MILQDKKGRNIAESFGNDAGMTGVDQVDDDNNDTCEDNDEKMDAEDDDIRGESEKPATTTMRVIPPHPQPKMMT
jgi:hypothetical protein